jgi:hypothetical protein
MPGLVLGSHAASLAGWGFQFQGKIVSLSVAPNSAERKTCFRAVCTRDTDFHQFGLLDPVLAIVRCGKPHVRHQLPFSRGSSAGDTWSPDCLKQTGGEKRFLAESCHGLKAGDGATAVDNEDRRASFKTIDEGAETVFSLSDAAFFIAGQNS